MQTLHVVGAGAQAREIIDILGDEDLAVVLVVDEEYLGAEPTSGQRIVSMSEFVAAPDLDFVLGLGAPGLKRDMAKLLGEKRPMPAVSKAAYVGSRSQIGPGTVLAPGAVVTTDVVLGKHVLVNVGATVSHDCRIGDFATISPGAHLGGHVNVGDGAFVGIGAVVKNDVRIASGCVLGAGAVVLRDLDTPNTVVAGNPGRLLRVAEDWLVDV
jgi:sugar O-acyltransferase (sialic acid O-acetyltransferase NeuD family)